MNLLGGIGPLVDASGLRNPLETVYADNTVNYLLSGKAVQRAFRGHLLVDRCLNVMVVSQLIEGDSEFASLVTKSEDQYKSCLAGECELNDDDLDDTLSKIHHKVWDERSKISAKSKTSQLWFGYQKMVSLARNLIRADRNGSWMLHLKTVHDCLPIFAAAGHYNYLKSAHLYLQSKDLEVRQPAIYAKFMQGMHVSRRTNQYWTGLGSDLVIEQTLMRSLKSSGGLTRGSGMSEEQRTLWALSRPIISQYNDAMQDFINIHYRTSEQHKETTEARLKRDMSDLGKIREKLTDCSPFTDDPSLRSLVTGVVAGTEVNVHAYKAVGNEIMQKMQGQNIFTYSFKRKDKAKTLGSASAVRVNGKQFIDPALLFQRLLIVAQSGEMSLQGNLEYELCPYPPALFEAKDTLRKADKPALLGTIYSFDTQKRT